MTNYKEKYSNRGYEGALSLYRKHLQPGLVEGEAAYHAILKTIESNERARNSQQTS